ncbi:MAG: tetratricopeptide repeat protein [Synergistaceae bacterium]|nr:tetratricopeptide repeat protein [Synergistaceae bacterium]
MNKNYAALFSFYVIFVLSMVFRAEASTLSLDIKQASKAYIGHPVAFEAVGEIVKDEDVSFEWAFSDNVTSIIIGKGGRSCGFTIINTSPAALNLKAIGENGDILSEAFLITGASEFDVDIRLLNTTMLQIWNPKTHMEEEAKEFAARQRLSFEVVISPDIDKNEKLHYKWVTSRGVSSDLPVDGKEITVWREEPGICSIEVEVTNINGLLLGKGMAFEEITISDSFIKESENRKISWEKWVEALKIWDNSDFMNVEGYEKALSLALEALKYGENDREIIDGVEKMKTENASIQRAKEYAIKGEEFKEREKWTESLASYRRSLAIWEVPQTEKAISDVEEIVRTIRLNREKATWRRDMALAYEEERRYPEAIKAYEESLLLDRQELAIHGIERAQALHENLEAATVLKKEAEEFLLSGDYSAAIDKLEGSYALLSDDITRQKIVDLEKLVSELKEKASQLKREGNEHVKRGQNAEALACFVESWNIWADAETEGLIKKYEEIVPEDQRLLREAVESPDPESKSEAARLLKEGTEFFRTGNYTEALNRYKKSYEIDKNKHLLEWIERIEGSIKAQASINESNRLINEGNALYSVGRYKEALECYTLSLELYPNKEIDNFIKHIEEILYN